MSNPPTPGQPTNDPTDFPFGTNVPPPTDPKPDPFDPASLRLSGEFTAAQGVKKAMLTVPIRKPEKSWWVRTHPAEEYRLQTAVIELKEDRETYLVQQSLWADLSTESTFSPRMLVTAINRQGVVFLWPIRLPGPDRKLDDWSQSALEAANLAREGWVRVAANMSLGAYDVFQATGNIPDPDWPDAPFKDLLRIGFRGKLIDSMDHPVLRRLRGEV